MSVMDKESAGKEAYQEVQEETKELLKRNNATPDHIISNFVRLSILKVPKPFCYQGNLLYSDPIDDGPTQRASTRDLAQIAGLLIEKHQVDSNLVVEVVDYGQNVKPSNDKG